MNNKVILKLFMTLIFGFYVLPFFGQYIVSHYTFNDNTGPQSLIFVDIDQCTIADTVPFPLPSGMSTIDISIGMRYDSLLVIGDHNEKIAIYKFNGISFDLVTPPFQFRLSDSQLTPQTFQFYNDWLYFNTQEDIFRYNIESQILQNAFIPLNNSEFIQSFTFHKDSLFFIKAKFTGLNDLYKADADASNIQLVMEDVPYINGIQLNAYLNSLQYHCENVQLIYWGELNLYSFIDYEVMDTQIICTDFIEEHSALSQADGFTWGYPQWSDCKLSIDLNLDDELYQFNRDYARIPCGHTNLSLSDDDVQVFASEGVIDSIVVELLNPTIDQYIIGTANGKIQIFGDGTSRLKLIANANASFDDYEDVIRSLRYIDDSPFNESTKEITFKAYSKGVHGIIATSTLEIQSETPYAGRDTFIELCADNTLLDLHEYIDQNISYSGKWIDGDGFLDISQVIDTVLYYEVTAIGCEPDTAAFYITIDKEVIHENIDTSFCADESILIDGIEYTSSQTITLSELNENCDSIYTTYNLYFEPLEQIFIDTVLCEEEVLLIENQEIDTSGEYEINLRSESGCDSLHYFITVEIDLNQIEEEISLQEFTIYENDPTQIELNLPDGFEVVSWYPQTGLDCAHCQLVEVLLSRDQKYQVEIINNHGCSQFLEICVELIPDIKNDLYIPNIFDPNDPSNSGFGVFTGPDITVEYDMQIFDRWGNLIFEASDLESNDTSRGWNGLGTNGQKLEQGVYVYRIVVEGQENRPILGNVTKL